MLEVGLDKKTEIRLERFSFVRRRSVHGAIMLRKQFIADLFAFFYSLPQRHLQHVSGLFGISC